MNIYRISATNWIDVGKIRGSPMCMVRHIYQCADSPSGWYVDESRPVEYVEAPNAGIAAQRYLDRGKLEVGN